MKRLVQLYGLIFFFFFLSSPFCLTKITHRKSKSSQRWPCSDTVSCHVILQKWYC